MLHDASRFFKQEDQWLIARGLISYGWSLMLGLPSATEEQVSLSSWHKRLFWGEKGLEWEWQEAEKMGAPLLRFLCMGGKYAIDAVKEYVAA